MEKVRPEDVKLTKSTENKEDAPAKVQESVDEMKKQMDDKLKELQAKNSLETTKRIEELASYNDENNARIFVGFISDGKSVIGTAAGTANEIQSMVKSALKANPLLHAVVADVVYSMSMDEIQIKINQKNATNSEAEKAAPESNKQ